PILEAAKIFSGIMLNLSKEPLYGSILQSIKRGRASEIDYINGEFVRMAEENNFKAPLNEKLVEMVHQVEKTGKFFSKEQLLKMVIVRSPYDTSGRLAMTDTF
ncbi:MAG: ketopantoate reductase C-terminal domain-containing protein, partial [Candidatus Omnitrophota bacterium]